MTPALPLVRRRGAVLVIVDGLSDVGLPVHGGLTPLQAAALPALDALTAAGQGGLLDPVAPGIACGSDTAHLALFGFEPRGCYRGRGALEAEGDGLEVRRGDVAFKCNFGVMDEGVVIRRRAAAGKEFAEMCRREIVDRLDGVRLERFPEVEVTVKHAMKHRCAVRLRAPPGVLSDAITDTDPLVDYGKLQRSMAREGGGGAAEYTAQVVNEVDKVLRRELRRFGESRGRSGAEVSALVRKYDPDGLVPNVVLLRGASEQIDVASTFESLHGLATFLIAPTKVIAGVGGALGIEVKHVAGATGDYKTNFVNKAHATVDFMLEEASDGSRCWRHDLGVLHVKAVDDAGHDGDLKKKILHMENVDHMVRRIYDGLVAGGRPDTLVAVTGDHTTPVSYADHSCEPVPFVIAPCAAVGGKGSYGSPWYADDARRFDEVDIGENGCLGRFPGLELMSVIKHHVIGGRA